MTLKGSHTSKETKKHVLPHLTKPQSSSVNDKKNSLKCFIIKELAAHCLATVFNYLFDFWKDFEMAVLIAKR